MRKVGLSIALCAGLLPIGSAASAGIYTDDLSRCVVQASSAADQSVLVRWMFGAVSANPDIADMVKVTDAQRDETTRAFAAISERLILQDCRKQAILAVKYEGTSAFEAAFATLGQVAGRGLMSSPEASKQLSKLDTYLDDQKWKAFSAEAGLPAKTPAK